MLLILAATSIAMLTGENGIIKRAIESKENTKIGEEKEQVELAYISVAMNKLKNEVTDESLQEELNVSVGKDKTNVTQNIMKLYKKRLMTFHRTVRKLQLYCYVILKRMYW